MQDEHLSYPKKKKKVANPREYGDYFRFPATEDDEEGGASSQQVTAAAMGEEVAMSAGLGRSREMTAMVTALTHVVSGQRQDRGETTMSFGNSPPPPSSVYSSSSSGSWGGQKREREEESGSQYFEQQRFQRVYTGFGDSRGESSSVSTG